jgi:hypothetical protein
MDELGIVEFIKTVSFFVGFAGVVFGIDALLGGRLISTLNTLLSKTIDFDKLIIGNDRLRRFLGVTFIIVSMLMLLLIKI